MNPGIIFSFFACILLISCSDNKKKIDCNKLRVGNFEYRGGASDRVIFIFRNDTLQIEKNEQTGEAMSFSITWSDECEYELKPLSYSINGKDSAIDESAYPPLEVRILKATDNYYVCRSNWRGGRQSRLDTMLIIHGAGGFKSMGDVFSN